MNIPFTYITTPQQLQTLVEELRKEKSIGVDLECENNLHHYGIYLSLIQLSTGKKHWIVDPLQVKDISSLLALFSNPRIQKVFHDISFDLRILHEQYGCTVKNIFDTQLAANFLGKTTLGLGGLLEEYYQQKKVSKFQRADWTKRPIPKDMLAYAIQDAAYLIPLRNQLKKELINKGRLSWVQQEAKHQEELSFTKLQPAYDGVKGFKTMTPEERGMFKALFLLREKMAKQVNKPSHFLLSNRQLKEVVAKPPSLAQWKTMKQTHPVVKRNASLFFKTMQEGKRNPITLPVVKRKRFSLLQQQELDMLEKKRTELSEKHKLKKHLFISQDQMHQVVITQTHKPLRPWQEQLLFDS